MQKSKRKKNVIFPQTQQSTVLSSFLKFNSFIFVPILAISTKIVDKTTCVFIDLNIFWLLCFRFIS